MSLLNKLVTLLTLQNNLNVKQHCPEWAILTPLKRNNRRAAYHELIEIYDHIGWGEWWKPAKELSNVQLASQKFQAQLELVDAFHFLLSEQISLSVTMSDLPLADILVETKDRYGIFTGMYEVKDPEKFVEVYQQQLNTILQTAAETMLIELEISHDEDEDLPTTHAEISMDIDALVSTVISEFHIPWADFFILCRTFGMDFTDLYTLYLCKNALNQLRSGNGYKQGTYIKNNWGGLLCASKEASNAHAEELELGSFTEFLYDRLDDVKCLDEDNSLMPFILEYLRKDRETFELEDVFKLYEEAYARIKI